MEALLARHWPALHRARLVTDDRPQIFRGLPSEKPGARHGAASVYVEIFAWKDGRGSQVAHETPAIMAVWEPMGAICEAMDFPHFEPFEPTLDG
jgi:hypothetical protein